MPSKQRKKARMHDETVRLFLESARRTKHIIIQRKRHQGFETMKKVKAVFTKKQFKSLLRPMFCGTKLFGYATDADVERMLENVVKDSPLIKGKEIRKAYTLVEVLIICAIILILGSVSIHAVRLKNRQCNISTQGIPK